MECTYQISSSKDNDRIIIHATRGLNTVTFVLLNPFKELEREMRFSPVSFITFAYSDSDHPERLPRLICFIAMRTCHNVFTCRGSNITKIVMNWSFVKSVKDTFLIA